MAGIGENGNEILLQVGTDNFNESAVRRIADLCGEKGIPQQFYKSVGSVIKRVQGHVKAVAFDEAVKIYDVEKSSVKRKTAVKTVSRNFERSGAEAVAEIIFSGSKIPLGDFDLQNLVQKSPKDRHTPVSRKVLQNSSGGKITNAFYGKSKYTGHLGVFQRKGADRVPIKEIMALSGIEMLSNKEVVESINESSIEMFDKRIEHEIDRIINGYNL